MADSRPMGTLFAEVDLDLTKVEQKMQALHKRLVDGASKSEEAFKTLGVASDRMFEAQKNVAIAAYDAIRNKATSTANDIIRAQSAMESKLASIAVKSNPMVDMWQTLGVRSKAEIDAQKAAVTASYDKIKASGIATSQDLINIEKAKNAKLKELNNEMVGSHDESMAAMTRAVLRFYAAWYVVSTAAITLKDFVMGGIKAIDDLKVSTIAVAAQITSMQGTTGNIVENYKENLKYAEALNRKLMEIDANSFANYEQIQLMNRAMNLQGVILDTNNAKQIDSFTALTNAVAMFTQGQDKQKQASQEIRSLMTGEVKAGNMVAQMMDDLIKKQGVYKGGLKELVAEGKKHGDMLERMQPYLVGIVAASGDIQNTWMAVSSSLETSWGVLQRGLFKDVYKGISESGTKAAAWIKKNENDIIESINNIWNTLKFAIESAIAAVGLFAVATWAASARSADALAWLALRWEVLTTAITASTSKMLIGWNVFIGGIVGFSLGTYLQNEFEGIRIMGVDMIYGLIAAWETFLMHLKKGSLTMKMFNPFADKDKLRSDMAAIGIEYDEWMKEHKRKWKEQLKDVTDFSQNEAKGWKELTDRMSVAPPKIDGLNDLGDKTDSVTKKAERLMEQWEQMEITLKGKIEKDGLTEFERKLIDIQTQSEKAKEKLDDLVKALNAAGQTGKAKSISKSGLDLITRAKESDIDNAVTEQAKKDFDELLRIEKDIEEVQNRRLTMQEQFYSAYENLGAETYELALERIEKEAKAFRDAKVEEVAVAKWAEQAKRDAYKNYVDAIVEGTARRYDEDHKYQAQSIKNAISIFDNASELVDKESKQYKLMQDAKKAMQIAELAMTIQKNMAILASMPAIIAAKEAEAVAGGATAIVTQGSGDPYTAFARVAAMTAIVASVLAAAGIAFGGGSSSGSSAHATPAMGNSTVLGAAYGTQSESIANSLEILTETYSMENDRLTKIYHELRSLNDNITGLVSALIRTKSIGSSLSVPSTTTAETWLDNMYKVADMVRGVKITDQVFGKGSSIGAFFDFPAKIGTNWIPAATEYLFGGTTKTKTMQTGISLTGSTVEDIMKNGILAQQYALIRKTKDGGLLGSDKRSYKYKYADVDAQVGNLFDSMYQSMGQSLLYFAESFGTDLQKIEDYAFESIKINLKGMTGEEMTEAITGAMSEVGDKAVEALFSDIIGQYQKINEGLMETAIRLITDKETVVGIMQHTNQTFKGTTEKLIEFAESLISATGTLDDLTDAFQNYYEAFFTDKEKQADRKEALQAAMGGYGLSLPGTRQGYRGLVEALDLTSEAGKTAYAVLMKLAETADEYYKYIEDAKSNVKESDYATRIEYERAVRGYASGGTFSGGVRIVGENGPELEWTGPSVIQSNTDSRKSLGTDDLIAEVKALREEVGQVNFNNSSTMTKLYRLLDQWNGEGMPETRT